MWEQGQSGERPTWVAEALRLPRLCCPSWRTPALGRLPVSSGAEALGQHPHPEETRAFHPATPGLGEWMEVDFKSWAKAGRNHTMGGGSCPVPVKLYHMGV